MRNTSKLLGALAAVLAVSAAAGPEVAAARSLHLNLLIRSNVVVHNGVAAPYTATTKFATGDTSSSSSDILKGKRTIGTEDVFCGQTTPLIQLCTAVDHLPGGQVIHIGATSIAVPMIVDAITGGTGRYAAARGSVVTRFSSLTAAKLDYFFAH